MDSGVRRRLALAEVDSNVSVVSSSILDASCGCEVGILVDSVLHLLEELINVQKVILGSQVGHWWQGILVVRSMGDMAVGDSVSSTSSSSANCNHSWSLLLDVVCGDQLVCAGSGKRNKTLSYLVIRGRVDLTALGITEEVIESIEATLSGIICSMLTNISGMADWVVDSWTV